MTVLKTVLATIIVVTVAALAFVFSGIYNIGADEPHLAITSWALSTIQERSVSQRADTLSVPMDFSSDENVRTGARSYRAMCQVCHLGPGIDPTPVHKGLRPSPPRLAEEAEHHSPEYLFWIAKHGIKMTGMPAWGETHSDAELWQITAFVKQLPQMSQQQYDELTQPKRVGSGNPGHSDDNSNEHDHSGHSH